MYFFIWIYLYILQVQMTRNRFFDKETKIILVRVVLGRSEMIHNRYDVRNLHIQNTLCVKK